MRTIIVVVHEHDNRNFSSNLKSLNRSQNFLLRQIEINMTLARKKKRVEMLKQSKLCILSTG